MAHAAELYTLSLHDALPISQRYRVRHRGEQDALHLGTACEVAREGGLLRGAAVRDRKSTSELQSHVNVVCRLLLEKKTLDARVTLLQIGLAVHQVCRDSSAM